MKTSKVYFRISRVIEGIAPNCQRKVEPKRIPQWYCIEYPAYNHVQDVELAVLRAKSTLGLHKAAERVFYIDTAPGHRYITIKTDGVFEFPSPHDLRELKSYTPENLASFLEIKPLESLA